MHKRVIVFLGKPGAGKGTQGDLLAKKRGWAHISTGDLLREKLKDNDDIVDRLKKIMGKGELVPPNLIVPILKKRLDDIDCQEGCILDGFPRNIEQAKELEQSDIRVTDLIYFHVSDEEVIRRLSGRLVHSASGRIYHEINNPPKREGLDDQTGEVLVRRKDDEEGVIRNRLNVYQHETFPLIDYYTKKEGVYPYTIDVSKRDISDVSEELSAILTSNASPC